MPIQTSSGTIRERWVKALLPAAIIVMGYMLLINMGNGRKIRALHSDLEEQRQTAVTENELASVAMRQRSAARNRDQLQEQITDARSRLAVSLENYAGGSHARQMMQIDELCRELSIGLLTQKPTSRVETSKLREEALKTLRKLVPPDAMSYRQLELVGKYGDMVTLMRRLPQSVNGIVPLGIELLEAKANVAASGNEASTLAPGERIWRVYVLM